MQARSKSDNSLEILNSWSGGLGNRFFKNRTNRHRLFCLTDLPVGQTKLPGFYPSGSGRTEVKNRPGLTECQHCQFPSTQSEVQEIKPFKGKPPWLPDTQSNKQKNSSTRLTTKEAQRSEIKKLATETLCEAWNKDTAAPHLRKIIGPIQSKPPGRDLYNSAPNRKIAAALAQLRTGHCGLNYYLWRFKKIESSKCEGCGYERETVEHYLLECPKFREERRKLRDKIGGVGKMKVKTLLGDKKIIGRTMEFVTNTKRFMEEQREKNGEQKHL
jgi:hypothetical protein